MANTSMQPRALVHVSPLLTKAEAAPKTTQTERLPHVLSTMSIIAACRLWDGRPGELSHDEPLPSYTNA